MKDMTIHEAIENLNYPFKERTLLMSPEFMEALKLGIEALKKIQYDRLPGARPLYAQLPGETTG